MTEFQRPLVALSLTQQDDSLLDYARLLVEQQNWKDVHFAHVATDDSPRWLELLREEVRRYFGEAGEHTLHAVAGARIDQILRLTVDYDRDVIVLGHRLKRSGRRSLARRLAMVSPTSVWLVPEGAPARITKILVPVDFSEASADAVAVAAGIARSNHLDQLQAVHMFFDPSIIRYDEHVQEVVGREESTFDEFLASIDTRGIEIERLLVEGTHTADDILRTAQHHDCDLIVMSTRGRSRAASVLLGSTTSETMAATNLPLLAVKHYGSRMSLLQALTNHRIWDAPSPKTN